MPLLGLEPATTEKAGENLPMSKDSNNPPRCFPLLGTKLSEHSESKEKSSSRRSEKRVCYGSLLRNRRAKSGLTPGETNRNGSRDCYGKLPERVQQWIRV